MEHDIFATNTHPDTLEQNIFQNRYVKNERDLRQNKTVLIISIAVFALGLFMYAIDFLLFDIMHAFQLPAVFSIFPLIGFVLLAASICGVLYALIYTHLLKRRIKLMREFGIDHSAVRHFEHQRASGRSKAFGNTTNRQKAFVILTEDWLYGAYVGTLLPLHSSVVGTCVVRHRPTHRTPPINRVALTFNNGKKYAVEFGTNGDDMEALQETLRQLLPNAQHTSDIW
ncbi:MAG: hypothetical protein FWE40_01690 [Oscillospiraceae bacterium]|jgi:hypothetical protein|nr:hypothetical protein [Oscillospiraceae bacterium]